MSLLPQQQAVVDTEDHCACIALPGSGKSHTSVEYIVQRIQENPYAFVWAISFTRKAAKELRERLISKMGRDTYEAHARVSTFDSTFLEQLRKALGGAKIELINPGERYNLVMRAVKSTGHTKTKMDVALSAVDHFSGFIDIPEDEIDKNPDGYDIFVKFDEFRRERKKWDFPSICRAVVKGQENGNVPRLPVSHIVVDEFQDCNQSQLRWLMAYANTDTTTLVVGDDDQSIYSFRGSNGYENFIQYKEKFNAITRVLNVCFRCKPQILFAGQRLIENNKDRLDKDMQSIHNEGGKVAIVQATNFEDELDKILEKIKADEDPSNWAVLARTNRKLWELIGMFQDNGIPYVTKEADSLLSSPFCDTYYKILEMFVKRQKKNGPDILAWMGASDADIEDSKEFGGLSRRHLIENYQLPEGKVAATTPDEVLFSTIAELLSFDHSIDEGLKVVNRMIEGQATLKKSEVSMLGTFSKIVRKSTSSSFREAAKTFMRIVEKAQKGNDKDDEEEKKGVELLTLHSSKGLQWNKVWIMNVAKDVLPPKGSSRLEIAEERRLLFVGMTRAIEELYISFPQNKKSRFLDEF
ncbi:ATP-dependent helicase [Vibrio coralliilyticus]|uniref:DNA 3'-5' helicase n=3 Tax=Vibrio TaxID=662 RepID=A0AAN0SH29_9VIBR|nr:MULTISPECIES: ATP-dependent helicase [Vibrio]CAH1583113.1 Plasmid conjugative transfer DNA helicase TrhI [Vibrio jasicida]AIW22484.1 hypothetical protein IX92_25805 [Vibrio coralliilyticus]MCZ2799145.1 ATP-dependent helicase [Vibrio alginolyticus]NOH37045.1 ATP-dependent helicase [Vibrio coralliilyticus]PAW00770.1 ATP-dependent helicase [Vibrio coralliilyticus]